MYSQMQQAQKEVDLLSSGAPWPALTGDQRVADYRRSLWGALPETIELADLYGAFGRAVTQVLEVHIAS